MPERIVIQNDQGLGDAVMTSGAIRDVLLSNPGRFTASARSRYADVFAHNPHLMPDDGTGRVVELVAPSSFPREDPPHLMRYMAESLAESLGVSVRHGRLGGDVYLSRDEQNAPPFAEGLSVVMFAGGKDDMPVKWWPRESYQAVADHLIGSGVTVIQAGGAGAAECPDVHHVHWKLSGVVDLVGKTSLRELMRLVYHADAVVGPISAGMHLAAALPAVPMRRRRPAVVIAGGREDPQLIQYPTHAVLHTTGRLTCCSRGGCWKTRTVERDGLPADCTQPISVAGVTLARCMTMVEPRDVTNVLDGYLDVAVAERDAIARIKQRVQSKGTHAHRIDATVPRQVPSCGW